VSHSFKRGVAKLAAISVLLLSFAAAALQDKSLRKAPQVLENYSFDFSAHKTPLAFDTYGAAVQLHNRYKLIPDIKDRQGAIVLNKRIMSDRKYEVDVEFTMKSDEMRSHGLAVMLLGEEPKLPEEFDPAFGYRTDFKGLGVFLYRSEAKKTWHVVAV